MDEQFEQENPVPNEGDFIPPKSNAKELYSASWKNIRSKFLTYIPFFVIGILFFALVGISSIYSALLLITVPFILVPLMASLTIIMFTIIEGKDQVNGKMIGLGIRVYFVKPIRGCYKVTSTILLGLLFCAILEPILILFIGLISQNANSPLYEEVNALLTVLGTNGTLGITFSDFAREYPALYNTVNILNTIMMGVLLLIFLYNQNKGTITLFISAHLQPAASRLAPIIYRRANILSGGALQRDYWAGASLSFIVPIIGFIIGALIGAYSPIDSRWMAVFAVTFAFVFYAIILIWHTTYMSYLIRKYEPTFANTSVVLMKETREQLIRMNQINEEEAQELRKKIEEEEKRHNEVFMQKEKEEDSSPKEDLSSSQKVDLRDYGYRDGDNHDHEDKDN